jgi:RHS repeat-associated protein
VRLHLDEDGAIAGQYRYGPFGEVMGERPQGYGFTGERWDHYIKMAYLRARHYQPETGRFVSRDPWRGNERRYIYAEDNPVRFVDPSGLKVNSPDQIGDIRTDPNARYQYSCNCGWLDWGHALSGLDDNSSLAQRIISRLEADVDWSPFPLRRGLRGIEVKTVVGLPWGWIVPLVDEIAIADDWELLDQEKLLAIAAGMFIEHSEHVEDMQGAFFGIGTSYYAEEDLPSDLIGLYVVTQMKRGYSQAQAVNEISNLCKLMTREESLGVYEHDYQNGARFLEGWRRWDARLIPLSQSCCCPFPRSWPSQFASLYDLAWPSQRDLGWWWWEFRDGIPQETNVEGVYALWPWR